MRPRFALILLLIAQTTTAVSFWMLSDAVPIALASPPLLQIAAEMNSLEADGSITVDPARIAEHYHEDFVRERPIFAVQEHAIHPAVWGLADWTRKAIAAFAGGSALFTLAALLLVIRLERRSVRARE